MSEEICLDGPLPFLLTRGFFIRIFTKSADPLMNANPEKLAK